MIMADPKPASTPSINDVDAEKAASKDGSIFKEELGQGSPKQSEVGTSFPINPSSSSERALTLKLDLRLLPVLALMYLFNALDKGNLGNAKTDSLEKDLHFKKNQYNIILSVFYVPYVLCAPPLVS